MQFTTRAGGNGNSHAPVARVQHAPDQAMMFEAVQQ